MSQDKWKQISNSFYCAAKELEKMSRIEHEDIIEGDKDKLLFKFQLCHPYIVNATFAIEALVKGKLGNAKLATLRRSGKIHDLKELYDVLDSETKEKILNAYMNEVGKDHARTFKYEYREQIRDEETLNFLRPSFENNLIHIKDYFQKARYLEPNLPTICGGLVENMLEAFYEVLLFEVNEGEAE